MALESVRHSFASNSEPVISDQQSKGENGSSNKLR